MAHSHELSLPRGLAEVDPAFMTWVLQRSGVITVDNEVDSQKEADVGMTAGYFSAIKKVKCNYRKPTDADDSFVAKAWPPFEILPKEAIRAMFGKDIRAYHIPGARFYPRPRAFVADYNLEDERWALVMEDADTFSEHKVHEHELGLHDVMRMLPKLADVAVA